MTKKLTLIGLAAAFLTLTGESCFLENKNIEVPFRGHVDLQFVTTGTSDLDIVLIDVAQEIADLEAEAEGDYEELVSIAVENGFWRLVANRGPAGTTFTGSMTVRRVFTNQSASLVDPTPIAIADLGTEFVVAPLNAAGVNLLVDGMNEYLQARNEGLSLPDLVYAFTWTSQSGVLADFTWEARLAYSVVGVFSVDVPDLWN
jgi:hypothetical protein